MKNLKLTLSLFVLCLAFATCKKDKTTPMPTVTDVDGNVYHTVKIGTQTWMVENLKTTHYNDNTPINNITDNTAWKNAVGPAYCWYNNNISNKTPSGALYNWEVVNTGKLAPQGWHVPSAAEYITLVTYLGGEAVAGGKLKESGTQHWTSPNTFSNSSGFTALPSGFRTGADGLFQNLSIVCNFWTSTSQGITVASEYQSDVGDNFYGDVADRKYGFSVRCIKD
jgi:uncharacterized protein (TIGR02145 family)